MKAHGFCLDSHRPGFDGGKLQNFVNEVVHPFRVPANDGEEATTALLIHKRTIFQSLDESDDGRERRAQGLFIPDSICRDYSPLQTQRARRGKK
jgi:hypothetical protein